MVLDEGHKPMNWPTSPLFARARVILMGCSLGRSISGTSSSFLMNFGMEGATGLKPGDFSNLLKASAAEIEVEGGESPPPGAAMEALRRASTSKPYSRSATA